MTDQIDADIVTIEELEAHTETRVPLPLLSKALGREVVARVTRIARSDYLSFLPAPPPEAKTWPVEQLVECELAWLASLPPVIPLSFCGPVSAEWAVVLRQSMAASVAKACDPLADLIVTDVDDAILPFDIYGVLERVALELAIALNKERRWRCQALEGPVRRN